MNEELIAAAILPWAKEHEPRAYELTLAVAKQPKKFAAYLARLVEKRYESDLQFRLSCPLRVLEETSLTVRLRVRGSDRVLEVKGRRAEGEREWSFDELAEMLDNGETPEFRAELKEKWDLIHDDRRSR